jgi:hypothetical protein
VADEDDGIAGGAIAGAIIGAFAGVAAAGGAIVFLVKRNPWRTASRDDSSSGRGNIAETDDNTTIDGALTENDSLIGDAMPSTIQTIADSRFSMDHSYVGMPLI